MSTAVALPGNLTVGRPSDPNWVSLPGDRRAGREEIPQPILDDMAAAGFARGVESFYAARSFQMMKDLAGNWTLNDEARLKFPGARFMDTHTNFVIGAISLLCLNMATAAQFNQRITRGSYSLDAVRARLPPNQWNRGARLLYFLRRAFAIMTLEQGVFAFEITEGALTSMDVKAWMDNHTGRAREGVYSNAGIMNETDGIAQPPSRYVQGRAYFPHALFLSQITHRVHPRKCKPGNRVITAREEDLWINYPRLFNDDQNHVAVNRRWPAPHMVPPPVPPIIPPPPPPPVPPPPVPPIVPPPPPPPHHPPHAPHMVPPPVHQIWPRTHFGDRATPPTRPDGLPFVSNDRIAPARRQNINPGRQRALQFGSPRSSQPLTAEQRQAQRDAMAISADARIQAEIQQRQSRANDRSHRGA